MTTDIIALSKGTTVLDLQGHTLTVTGNTDSSGITSAIDMTAKNSEGAYVQDITIKNGTIKYTGTQGSKAYAAIDANYAKKYVFDGITLTAENKLDDAIIKCSTAVNLEIKDSTFTVNAVYVLGSNNLEGQGGKITIEGSSLTTSREDGDCTALLCTVVGANVTIKDSTLTGDRQGVLARTGTWTIEDSTLVTTGKFLTISDTNKSTNTGYLSGYWNTDTEVPVAALVAGDTSSTSYNEAVTLNAKNTILKASEDNAFKLVARGDGTYKTNITFDTLTYVNSVNSHDVGRAVNLNTSNVISITIAKANALGTEIDNKNIYKVSGVLKSIANSEYGNCYIEDTETGKTLYLYGAYTEGTYSKDSNGNLYGKGTTAITSSLIGYNVTAYGIYSPYKGAAQLKNAIVVKGNKVEGLTASISVNDESLGSASLSKTEGIIYGEEITVTATPSDGCSVESVVLTDKAGNETNITEDMKFTASAGNTVKVNFEAGTVVKHKLDFTSYSSTDGHSSGYTTTWKKTCDSVEYTLENWNCNWQDKDKKTTWTCVKAGRKKTTKNGTTTFTPSIAKISATFANAISSVTLNLGTLSDPGLADINEAYVLVKASSDATESLEKVTFTPKTGDNKIALTKKAKNCYYSVVFDTKGETSSNGYIVLNSLTFTE